MSEQNTEIKEEQEQSKLNESNHKNEKNKKAYYPKSSIGECLWMIIAPLILIGVIGYYGYVAYLAYKTMPETLPTPVHSEEELEEIAQETPNSEVLESKDYQAISNQADLSVYQAPSEESPSVGVLALNQEVTLLEVPDANSSWVKVEFNGQEAYVQKDFLMIHN